MKAYLITTGTLFAILTVAHIWRMFAERQPGMVTEMVPLIVITAALTVWAGWLLRRRA